jgi:hypothetical protein
VNVLSHKELTRGVFWIPALLSPDHISVVMSSRGRAPLLFCGPGSGEEDSHYVDSEHLEEHKRKQKKKRDGDKPEGTPVEPPGPIKPHDLPGTAMALWEKVRAFPFADMRPVAVDQHMKRYRLCEGHGIVAPHRDDDFPGPLASVARYSLLVYLNDEFAGGETVFEESIVSPDVPVGGGLLFRHDVLHEGLRVLRGTKHVLKTDVFVVS